MSRPLQFGIPSFDVLFSPGRQKHEEREAEQRGAYTPLNEGTPDYGGRGIRPSEPDGVASLCLIGPDGTGKSVFGMHLAAQYMADLDIPKEPTPCPRVLYVSTDLKYEMAHTMWGNFKLDDPNGRFFPFHWGNAAARKYPGRKVKLKRLDPAHVEKAELDRRPTDEEAFVYFVDLVSRSMGDDWNFVNRLLALLDSPPKGTPHLMVIDAVEGFETLVGDKDAFGETTSRRSRIAQIMRTASNRCHVCLIVEEPKAEARFPEEFVTDVVVRFRTTLVGSYLRRTLEIEKSRGQPHARGQHPFVIRKGRGSTTGNMDNPDDPQTDHAYVNVYPSLHLLSREEMQSRMPANPKRDEKHVAAFGIRYLDDMLLKGSDSSHGFDEAGLQTQTTTALIGEAATQTTDLATAFLARAFRAFVYQVADAVKLLTGVLTEESPEFWVEQVCKANDDWLDGKHPLANPIRKLKKEFASRCKCPSTYRDDFQKAIDAAVEFVASLPQSGAAVLITTSNQNCIRLKDQFDKWLNNSLSRVLKRSSEVKWLPSAHSEAFRKYFRNAVFKHIEERTICRRLELHDLASPILFHICQQAVKKAQELVIGAQERVIGVKRQKNEDPLPSDRSVRFRKSWNIRVVLDDLNTLKTTYPEIRADPIFLPSLLQFLELEGVTSLIVECQNGRPDTVLSDAFDEELRALVPHALLTWRVPFFGSVRDAITLLPPYPEGRAESVVREVVTHPYEGEKPLFVDPELELYSGLEKGEPQPIPLEVQLFAEESSMIAYIAEENEIFARLFTPLARNGPQKVVIGVDSNQYDALHDFCNLQTNTRLDYTMVFQVDEFWATDRKGNGESRSRASAPTTRREGALYRLTDYLNERTSEIVASANGGAGATKLNPLPFSDRYGVFAGPPLQQRGQPEPPERQSWRRRDFFRYSLPAARKDRAPGATAAGPGGPAATSEDSNTEDQTSDETLSLIDRIPFAWDFGFLLCPSSMWESERESYTGYRGETVGNVWESLPKAPSKGNNEMWKYVSWRSFLGASRAVARAYARADTPISVLDVSTMATESLLCLVMEVWASEIADLPEFKMQKDKQREFFGNLNHVDWNVKQGESLYDWLGNRDYILAFYKAWLLLAESLPMGTLTEDETIPRLRIRAASGNAAATRHWYKTSCNNQLSPIKGELAIPVRLPGHFSVRGDWFLAVAWGSRSERLGWRALDLLSTRRANFRRMELGIGLPTRDVASEEYERHIPTALGFRNEHGLRAAITYGDLVGRVELPEGTLSGGENGRYFNWLWRSQLHGYHRQSRLLHSWLAQVVALWRDPLNQPSPRWADGFAAYDALDDSEPSKARDGLKGVRSWEEFIRLCSVLREQLQIAAGRPDSPRKE
jgi:hypothetical protein